MAWQQAAEGGRGAMGGGGGLLLHGPDTPSTCWLARAEAIGRVALVGTLAYMTLSGTASRMKGLILMAEGTAVRRGLILTTTLRAQGRSGLAERSAGRESVLAGATQLSALNVPESSGFSPWSVNFISFARSGEYAAACG